MVDIGFSFFMKMFSIRRMKNEESYEYMGEQSD